MHHPANGYATEAQHRQPARKEHNLGAEIQATSGSKKLYWAGWVMGILPALMMLVSGGMKLSQSPMVVEGFAKMGFPEGTAVQLGILELVITLLYLIPRTSVIGAILLTGYLGGAIVTHLRISEPYFMPILLGVLLWGGLFLRDARVRALIQLVR